MPYVVKKFIAQFLMPIPLVCEFYLLGWCLRRFTQHRRIGLAFEGVAVAGFLAFGCGIGHGYLYNLERRYPPFETVQEKSPQLQDASVVVLGQGMYSQPSDLPKRYLNNGVFERRLFEGVRIAKCINGRLIVSMAGNASAADNGLFLSEYLQSVGFPTNRATFFCGARDTNDEALLTKRELVKRGLLSAGTRMSDVQTGKEYPFVLVSSAIHLPRAMTIFGKYGMTPVPAPCDYTELGKTRMVFSWCHLPLPSGGGFEISQKAVREWLGNVYENNAFLSGK